MRISLYSDLHLEFHRHREEKVWQIPETNADVIILAGDIDVGDYGIKWAANQSQRLGTPIIYVTGNHEFYRQKYQDLLKDFKSVSRDFGVVFLENDQFVHKGVRFLGCTLWTDYRANTTMTQAKAMDECRWALADHTLIRIGDKATFMPDNALRLHIQSLNWLKARFDDEFEGKTVVVTHHCPSMNTGVMHPGFPVNQITGAFHSNLDYLINRENMAAWFFGHTHFTCETEINGVLVASNQKGYPSEDGGQFSSDKVYEI